MNYHHCRMLSALVRQSQKSTERLVSAFELHGLGFRFLHRLGARAQEYRGGSRRQKNFAPSSRSRKRRDFPRNFPQRHQRLLTKISAPPQSFILFRSQSPRHHYAGCTCTADPYASTSVTPCITSVASYRTPITAFAPRSIACCIINSSASSRVFSHISSNKVMFPPTRVSSEAPIVPKILLERTVTPRTNPRFFTTRYPGNSNAVVTILMFTLTFICSSHFRYVVVHSDRSAFCASRILKRGEESQLQMLALATRVSM